MVKFRTDPSGATSSFRDYYSIHGLNIWVRCASGNVYKWGVSILEIAIPTNYKKAKTF